MKVLIIGGGPAGMIAAYSALKDNNEVIIVEKNSKLGRKMAITGKGRCNITSGLRMEEFIKNTSGNGKFLYSSFKNFTNEDILKLIDIPVKLERGNRYFPVSDKAEDVILAIENKIKKSKIYSNTLCKEILVENNKVIGIRTESTEIFADKVILATGGMSYPSTGSTGDGYLMAEKLGHTISEIKPSLVPLTVKGKYQNICKDLTGLSLRNVKLTLYNNNKKIYEDFGEMLFTHFGVSGPIVLSASAHLVRTKLINPYIEIDLKPALSEEKLEMRILRDFEKNKNKDFKNSLDELLPQKMIKVFVDEMNLDKKVNEIKKEERKKLVKLFKNFKIEISGFGSIKEAIITAGGINIKEINPRTMESKIINGLYFAGEIIDVDAYTGGFNLQIAYSTGFTAGKNNDI